MSEKRESEEEEYIVNESPEISVGEHEGWISGILSAFPALQNKNYQLYFSGQLISLIGTWLQIVAQGWLVLQLTNSAFLIGLITALSTLPTLFLTLFGGVIVEGSHLLPIGIHDRLIQKDGRRITSGNKRLVMHILCL